MVYTKNSSLMVMPMGRQDLNKVKEEVVNQRTKTSSASRGCRSGNEAGWTGAWLVFNQN